MNKDQPKLPYKYSTFTQKLVSWMLQKDADKRPSIGQILELPEIQKEVQKIAGEYPSIFGSKTTPKSGMDQKNASKEKLAQNSILNILEKKKQQNMSPNNVMQPTCSKTIHEFWLMFCSD